MTASLQSRLGRHSRSRPHPRIQRQSLAARQRDANGIHLVAPDPAALQRAIALVKNLLDEEHERADIPTVRLLTDGLLPPPMRPARLLGDLRLGLSAGEPLPRYRAGLKCSVEPARWHTFALGARR